MYRKEVAWGTRTRSPNKFFFVASRLSTKVLVKSRVNRVGPPKRMPTPSGSRKATETASEGKP